MCMGKGYEKEFALEDDYLMRTYGRKPVEFVRGEGMNLYDDEGNEYLDFIGGIGAVPLGHAHPAVTAALQAQAGKLIQVSNYYYVENRGEVARELSRLLGTGCEGFLGASDERWRTFFANSGAEANEGAIKLARCYGNACLGGHTAIVTASRSFHGRTLATLFATGQPSKQAAFLPEVPGFIHTPLNDVRALEEVLDSSVSGGVCAVMLECIQGEGGVNPCTVEFLQAARQMTLDRGMLLIIDEIQTGFFRTGKPFSYQCFGIVPDIVTVAKGLGNGVPIGGFCAKDSLAACFKPGDHGSTFGGNALVCAVARAVLSTLDGIDAGGNACAVGGYLASKLAELPHVTEVRGKGLMLAAQTDADIAPAVVDEGLRQGLVLNCVSSCVLRFLPPLICSTREVDILIERLGVILEGF